MKKVILSLAAVALLFAACKKDDDKANHGSFTLKGKSYSLNYGFSFDNEEFLFMSTPAADANYTGYVNYVEVDLDTLIEGRTYTYNNGSDYDKTKNFSWGGAEINAYVVKGDLDNTKAPDAYLDGPTAGTVTVKKASGGQYQFEYSLTFAGDSTVTGTYSGPVKSIE
jgi:hypothetical protein